MLCGAFPTLAYTLLNVFIFLVFHDLFVALWEMQFLLCRFFLVEFWPNLRVICYYVQVVDSGHHHPIGEVIVTFISRLYYVGNLAIFFTLTNKITWANGSKIKSEPLELNSNRLMNFIANDNFWCLFVSVVQNSP